MFRRLTLATALLIVFAAPAAARAAEPFWTQRPDLTLQGNRLYASNGGWWSYSGPVTRNLYRFVRDGVVIKGYGSDVPKSTPPWTTLPGVTPDDPQAPYYAVRAGDVGHCFIAQVWGGTRSTYYTAAGELVYDVWEWGNQNSFGEYAVTNRVCIDRAPIAPGLVIAPQLLPGARATAPYAQRLTVVGGAPPFRFSVGGGSLPPGVTLSPAGVLSGAPDARAGEYAFTAMAVDANGDVTALELVFTVLPPRLRFADRPLPAARRGHAYTAVFSVSGGSAPYAFRVVAGHLPPGLALDPHGTVHGRARIAGSFALTVRATDHNGVAVEHYYALRVR
jgi:hypothetical protein